MGPLATELGQAARSLLRTPLFTAVIVLSLALGIGANTAIFTFADQLLLRFLPVPEPERLVQLNVAGGRIGTSYGRFTISYPMYRALHAQNTLFDGLLASYSHSASLRFGREAEAGQAELVSGNYFQVLGVRAAAGRLLTPEDDQTRGAHPVAVLSYQTWKNRFGRNPSAIGRIIHVNNHPFTIIGVSEEGFDGLDVGAAPALRVPLAMKRVMTPTWDGMDRPEYHWLQVFGRLRPGVTPAQALAQLDTLRRTQAELEVRGEWWNDAPADARKFYLQQRMELLPASKGQSFLRRQYHAPLQVLMAIVGLVLLIACANVAGLLLARAVQRQKEIAVRFSLGATRAQVARRLLLESLLLAGAGGTAGILVSLYGCEYLLAYVQANGQSMLTLSPTPDARVLLFTLLLSVATGILFGLAPIWQLGRVDVASAIKNTAGAVSAGRQHVRLRQVLVASQIALSVLLLTGAGLFLRTLHNLRRVDTGIDTSRLLVFTMDPTLSGFQPRQTPAFYAEVYRRLSEIPGVVAVSGGGNRILSNDDWNWTIRPEGWSPAPGDNGNALFNPAGPGYFRALGVPILEGRDFLETDGPQRQVAIVNQAFANRFFGGANPVGRRLALSPKEPPVYEVEIIGLVAGSKYVNLREGSAAQFFMPYATWPEQTGRMNILVRFQGDPRRMTDAVRRAVRAFNPNVPLYDMRTMSEQVEQSLVNERLVAVMAAAFGALAALLAAIGLYGLLSFQVARRIREIGLRMALGASRPQVAALVFREVARLLAIGAAAGLAASLALSQLVRAQLFNIAPNDPWTLAAAVVLLTSIVTAAALAPTFRATRVAPMEALRYE